MLKKQTPLRPYFVDMPHIGEALGESMLAYLHDNAALVAQKEAELAEAAEAVKRAGLPEEIIHKKDR